MKTYFTRLHYEKNPGKLDVIVTFLLMFFSLFYSIAARTRNFLYRHKILKIYTPPVFTISVGNITTGGTGKTPITAAIANYLSDKNEKVAVLSRGYGAKLSNKKVNLISDNGEIFHNAKYAGDEPFWLAKNCPKSSVIISYDRKKAAKYAINQLKCTKIVLDDGFQHQKLARDLNIAVIDYEKKFGNGFILPAGPLREPRNELSRADKIIVVNKTNDIVGSSKYMEGLECQYNKPVYLCNMMLESVYNLFDDAAVTGVTPDNDISRENIIAFCAIAQPEQFYHLLEDNNYNVIASKSFEDHHNYTPSDLTELILLATCKKIKTLITTEKDAVKLSALKPEKDLGIDFMVVKLNVNLDVERLLND